jgi:hypothetical protein
MAPSSSLRFASSSSLPARMRCRVDTGQDTSQETCRKDTCRARKIHQHGRAACRTQARPLHNPGERQAKRRCHHGGAVCSTHSTQARPAPNPEQIESRPQRTRQHTSQAVLRTFYMCLGQLLIHGCAAG